MLKFCKIPVKSNFFLAPMAAVTNLPFRLLCKKHGCGLAFTEQINATMLARKPEIASGKKFFPIQTCNSEKPVGIQLFGFDEKDFISATELVEKKFDLININCGCPSPTLTKTGAGAALLKNPEKIFSILSAVKSVSSKPVTAKIRLGWGKNDSLKILKNIEKSNCNALIVHGRTGKQHYSGKADWLSIKKIAIASSIPVVANGDIVDGKSAEEILSATGAKFAMVGRGAMGNPLVFREIEAFLKKNRVWKPSPMQKISAFFDYAELCKKFNQLDLIDLKIQSIYFSKGIESAKKTRVELLKSKKIEDVLNCMKELEKNHLV